MNDTFWDAQNLEIEACANFEDFSGPAKKSGPGKNYGDWMLWVLLIVRQRNGAPFRAAHGTEPPGSIFVKSFQEDPHKKYRPCDGFARDVNPWDRSRHDDPQRLKSLAITSGHDYPA